MKQQVINTGIYHNINPSRRVAGEKGCKVHEFVNLSELGVVPFV